MAEIRNPNQQGGGKQQDSRSFLVFALVFLVMLLALQYFRPKKPQPTEQKQQQSTPIPTPASPVGDAATTAPAENAKGDNGGTSASPVASVTASSEQTTTVENENYRIVFTNRGAQVVHWILKDFKDDFAALHDGQCKLICLARQVRSTKQPGRLVKLKRAHSGPPIVEGEGFDRSKTSPSDSA